MGEQITNTIDGTLYHASHAEAQRVANLDCDPRKRAAIFATVSRLNTLYMVARAGSGHLGGSFSSMDILSWLFLEELGPDDLFFSSKGHDAPGYYSIRIGMGQIPEDALHKLRRMGGLPGHPDVGFPGIITNTGSLGMGVSKAKGMIFAHRQKGEKRKVFVLLGDGELQEGQIWESLVSAANHKMGELTVIVDHNKLQSDTFVKNVSDLGDLDAKFASFGWEVARCDGNDIEKVSEVFKTFATITDKPKVLIADTIKGKGVRTMEHTAMESDAAIYRFHSGAPDANTYQTGAQELIDTANRLLAGVNAAALTLEVVEAPKRPGPGHVTKQIAAYSRKLIENAKGNDKIVALDADLMLDMGLIPFKDEIPARFLECGIAEQDMVSQAGGMARNGLLPVVNSFSCFLTSRPNEQIYNNATEHSHIVYVGGLSGMIPAGPGHSHQAVRDIATMRGIPGMVQIAPSTEAEVEMATDYVLNTHNGPAFLRLESVPWPVPFELPDSYRLEKGKGVALTSGDDAVLFAYGSIFLTQAWHAVQDLKEKGIHVSLVNLPWVTEVDTAWLKEITASAKAVVTLDNHYLDGGMGHTVLTAMAEAGIAKPAKRLGIEGVPAGGGHDEVLAHHGFDPAGISKSIADFLKG
ncbi:MAG: transketolase [Rhodospirillum sp.]|nr:transketolase [Rhodospirillum sp.]MCF8488090.1 transketolase [Rhodospirillum sp.]MCF8499886.1 transketolase [Rhodospirillum sp.]